MVYIGKFMEQREYEIVIEAPTDESWDKSRTRARCQVLPWRQVRRTQLGEMWTLVQGEVPTAKPDLILSADGSGPGKGTP